jgi:hypothetical protein
MSFDGYFTATESAFVHEKEHMLDHVVTLRDSWNEAVVLDTQAVRLCGELQTLKELLSRSHLQILRTREEILRTELLNAQRSFRLRQLQSEIWRLLPHAHCTTEYVDYELSVCTSVSLPGRAEFIDPDEELAKEFAMIEKKWDAMLRLQETVFAEEMDHRLSDNVYFEGFQKGFIAENTNAHEAINRLLGKLVTRLVTTKKDTDEAAVRQQEALESAERRHKMLLDKARALPLEAQKQARKQRKLAQRRGSLESRAVRSRIQIAERSNRSKLAELQERNSEQHARHREVLGRVRELQKREDWLVARGTQDLEPLDGQLMRLEAQMNALVSAAAAIPVAPVDHHGNLLRMVSTAIGAKAHAADSVERVGMEVRNLKARAGRRRG